MCRKPHTGLLHGIYSPEAHEESGTCQRHGCCQYPAFALPFSGSNVPARSSDPCMPEVDTGRPRLFHIPPELVVKRQAIDIFEAISLPIWQRNIVQTSCRNRKWRCELLSPSEDHWSTTKSGGVWNYPQPGGTRPFVKFYTYLWFVRD